MTDGASGTPLARHDYLPFGVEVPNGSSGRVGVAGAADGLSPKFTGQDRDKETGLDYFGARYMSSAQGRFTSPDPLIASAKLEDPQTWNRYAYVTNNPLRFVDPDGKQRVDLEFEREQRMLLSGQMTPAEVRANQNARGVGALAGLATVGSFFAPEIAAFGRALLAGVTTWSLGHPELVEETSSRVLNALGSADPAKQMEGKVAQSLSNSGLLKDFDVTVAGRQIDVIAGKTGQFVVEVTTGGGRGKIGQAMARMNATGRQVVIYGEELSKGFIKEAQRQGISVAQNLE